MNFKTQAIKTIFALSVLLIVLLFIRPDSLPVGWLFVTFALIFTFYYQAILLVGLIIGRLGAKVRDPRAVVIQARVIGSFLLVVTLLQSLGQLSIRDILTFSLVFGCGYLYFYRLRQGKQKL